MTPPQRLTAPVSEVVDKAGAALAATSCVRINADDDWEDEVRPAVAPPVAVLLDPHDDAAVTRTVLASHWLAAGRVVVHPTPSTSAPSALAHDLLAALGRPVSRLPEQRIAGGESAWQAVTAWVLAEEVGQIIVLRAHMLSEAGWRRLLELRAHTRVELVMVWHADPAPSPWRQLLDGVASRETSEIAEVIDLDRLPPDDTELDDELGDEPDEPGRSPDVLRWDLPPLPEGDVTNFRAEAWRQLPPHLFGAVDDAYQYGLRAACRWLAGHPEQRSRLVRHGELDYLLHKLFPGSLDDVQAVTGAALLHGQYPEQELRSVASALLCVGRGGESRDYPKRFADEVGLQVFLGSLAGDALSRRRAIARLRGAQAGAMLHGLLIALPSNLMRCGGPGLGTAPFGYKTADRIRSCIASPVHAAALATALFTGCTSDDLSTILVEQLAEDGSLIAVPGAIGRRREGVSTAVFVVPEPARPFLLAARTFLRLRGTPLAGKLLHAGIGAGARVLQTSAEAAGLPLPVTELRLSQCWTADTTAWWIGTHLHHPGGEHE